MLKESEEENKPLEYFVRNSELGVVEELFLTNKVLDHLGIGYIEFFIKENRNHLSASYKELLGYKENELSDEFYILERLIYKDDIPDHKGFEIRIHSLTITVLRVYYLFLYK